MNVEDRMNLMSAGALIVAYVNDARTNELFWRAVNEAQALYKLGDGDPDAGRG